MMMTSAKMPPIIGPIMSPMFVDLDVGDPNIGFPGAYLQGFTFYTHQRQWIPIHWFQSKLSS
jgi:hypothetical protein